MLRKHFFLIVFSFIGIINNSTAQDRVRLINDQIKIGKIAINPDSSIALVANKVSDEEKRFDKRDVYQIQFGDGKSYVFWDEIKLLDGSFQRGKVTSVNDTLIIYEVETKSKIKLQSIDPLLVYSILYKNGKEEVVYKPLKEGDLAVDDMRYFQRGLGDASKSYKTPGSFVGGALLGAASVMLFPFSYLYPAVGTPILYTTGHFLPIPKINIEKQNLDNILVQNEKYVLGYKEGARKKRIGNALKSSIGGVVLGIITYSVVAPKL